MRKALSLQALGLFFLSLFFFPQHAEAKRPMELKITGTEARVKCLEGSARILAAGKGVWRALREQDILRGGDEVRTGAKTKIELIMQDESVVRFADNSHFKIIFLDTGDETRQRNIKIYVAIGRSWVNLSRAIGKRGNFELTSENAVAGVRGTIYRMNVENDKSALIRVYDGQVSVSGGGKPEERKPILGPPTKITGPKPVPGPRKVTMEEWVYIIKAMQQIRIGSDGMAEKPREFTDEEDRDEWVDWNKSKDEEL